MTLMTKLLVINVTLHMPQNMTSDAITHVTINTINGLALPGVRWGLPFLTFYVPFWHGVNVV